MKRFQDQLPFFLLFSYSIYSCFISINIAHSIIILSLAALCAYQSHISRQETTKLNKEILEQLKSELEKQIIGTKEQHEKKILKLEDELAKLALNSMPLKTTGSSSSQPRKMVF